MRLRLTCFIRIITCFLAAAAPVFYPAMAQLSDTRWSEPVNMGELNTAENEFAPAWNRFESRLYFNSDKTGYSLFYTSGRDSNGFSSPKILPGEINQKGNNQSYITFATEEIAYLSTYRQSVSRSYLNLFQTFNKKKEWIKPFLIDSLASDSFSSHPAVSPDGTVMVFSSDRQKAGETDLWITYLQPDGSWSGLENISELNSPGNEITPYLASDDTLYFASDGLGGPGGYDLFMSVRSDGIWQRPYPLSDLNTKYDESDFTLLPGGYAVFSSDRPGGRGKLDLYMTKSYLQSRQGNIFTSDLELSVGVQVQSLRTLSRTNYRSLPLVPYIFPGTSLAQLIESSGKIYPCVDSVFISTLHILGDRLRQFTHASIYIRTYTHVSPGASTGADSLSTSTAAQVKSFLIEKENILAERISITPVSLDDNSPNAPGSPLVSFDSDEPAIFEPIQIGSQDVTVEPSGLEIAINARPQKMVKSWVFGFKSGDDSKLDTIKTGTDGVPFEFSVDLKPFGKRLSESDSLVLNLTCTDSLGQMATKDYAINVAHSEMKGSELIKKDQRAFEEYLFFIADGNSITTGNLNTLLIQKIIASAEYTNGLTVRYFDSSPLTVKNAGILADALKKKLNNSYVRVGTELAPYSGKESFGKQLAPYMLSVLVEK